MFLLVLRTALWLSIAVTAATAMPGRLAFIETLKHFSLYWLAAHLIALPLILLLRRRRGGAKLLLLLTLGCIGRYTLPLIPFITAPEVDESVFLAAPAKSGVSALFVQGAFHTGMLRRKPQLPEIVALSGDTALEAIPALRSVYPQVIEARTGLGEGVAIAANCEISAVRDSYGEDLPAALSMVLVCGDARPLTVALVRTRPGFKPESIATAYRSTRRLATELRHNSSEVLLFADLHRSYFTSYYQIFSSGAEMSDARYGRGFLTDRWRLPEFHVLQKNGVVVRSFHSELLPNAELIEVGLELRALRASGELLPGHAPRDVPIS